MRTIAIGLAFALLAGAGQVRASLGDAWPLLGFARAGDCELAITSSGRAMQWRASGLIPGEALRLRLTNGDMVPIERILYAKADGSAAQFYLPFRFNRDGGNVTVMIDASRCQLSAAAPWQRGISTIR